jgi:hypothetical protein
MEVLYFILGGLLVLGVVVSIIEWRRKRKFLRHDTTLDAKPSGHLMAERERALHHPGFDTHNKH